MSSDNDRMLRRRLLGLARPHAKQMAALLLLDLLDGFMVLLTPLPLKVAIDSVVGSRPLPGLLRQVVPESVTASAAALLALAVGLLLAVALLGGLLGLATSLLRAWVGSRLVRRLRGRMFLHAQHLSLSYHDAAGTADAVYRINQDAGAVEDVLIDGVLPVAGAALTVALIFVVTLWLDWQLALVAALVAPALLFLSWRCKGRLRRRSREIKRLESGALAILHEVLSAGRSANATGSTSARPRRPGRACG